ncbi:hypothetical protein SEA_SHAWTY_17 [Streptomyces phage Shawty]|uniref:Uncharacterized protein n=1 Tax=Streptomyces phage Shawty TaxID=2510521 RepID=A0A411CYH2_9CAUD|nr:hypothetical protein SEA_SHAWTY_17 [Streptomyces phage Shawty]
MDLSSVVGTAEIVGGALVVVLVIYRQARTGVRDAWRDAAESHRENSEALEKQVATLVTEVRALRIENEALRGEVALLRAENRDLRMHIDSLIGGDA